MELLVKSFLFLFYWVCPVPLERVKGIEGSYVLKSIMKMQKDTFKG